MSQRFQYARRYVLAVLGVVALASCSSGGTDNTNPGTIAVTVNPTSGTATQGGQVITTATLTRGGGFTGTVNFTVTGAPTGVTAAVTNVVTTGTTTTATVTISAPLATPAGSYPLVLHATGTGVTEATANYTLAVVLTPAVALSLSPPDLTIVQGGSTPTTTVTLSRTNFTGDVTLSVDNLPTGVTATFAPANPQNGTSAVLTLHVPADATPVVAAALAVRATGAGITAATTPLALTIMAAPGSFDLSLTQPALSIVQGASTPTTTVNIVRTNFPVGVTLSVLNLPMGVTAAFAPDNPVTANSSVLTLTVAASAPVGLYNLSVEGVSGGFDTATPLALTITAAAPVGNFTLSTTPPTTVSVTQGGAAVPVTVTINHTGGNASSITLSSSSATALPAGLGLAFSAPNPTTAGSGTLTITATGAVPVAAYPIVIHGNTAGLGEQLVNLTINVVAPSGSGSVTASFVGCDPFAKPIWLAFMDGTSGTWTRVTGVGDVYQFTITQAKASLAYVTDDGGDITIVVSNLTQAELTGHTLMPCVPLIPGKTVHGTLLNRGGSTFTDIISFAGRSTSPTLNVPFQIGSVPNGIFDLIAYERQPLAVGSGDRLFIKRGENPAAGGNFSVPVDFQDVIRSTPPIPATITLSGLNGEAETTRMNYLTGAGCTPAILYSGLQGLGTTNMYGVPPSFRVAGDMHQLEVSITGLLNSTRFVSESFLDVAARSATSFVMPATYPTPIISDAGGPYKRPMVVVTGLPPEYNTSHAMLYSDQGSSGVTGLVSASQGWVGGSAFTLVLPNFHGVPGFLDSWAPSPGDPVDVQATSGGNNGSGFCTAGARFVTASRSGTI